MTATYCRICEAACGLLAEVEAGGAVRRLRPDRDHPVSRGFVCAKGTRFPETAAHPDRLLYPQRRRPDGSYERIAWADALALWAERLRPLVETYGPHAVGIYFGNPLAFNALGAVTMLGFMQALGTRNVFHAGSQDCNNKFAGAQILHGSPLIHPIPDFERADVALLFGTNPAISQTSFVHLEGGSRLFDRMIERGAKLIWVDPRRTESVTRWGEHVPLRPGMDIFLLLTLINELRDRYRPDETSLGLAQWLEIAADFPPTRAAALTGLDSAQIVKLAHLIRTADRTTFHMSVGVNQGPFGTLCYIALHALAYLSGNVDQAGGLLFHPLAVAAGQMARWRGIDTSDQRSRVGNFPSLLNSLPGGILADEILTPGPEQIRALLVVAGDPVRSIPGADKLRLALSRLDFLVSLDLFPNATNAQADLRLPTTSWLERWDVATTTTFFQQTPLLQYSGPLQSPPGEARSEAHILADLSLALNRPLWGSRWLTRLWQSLAWDRGLGWLTDIVAWPFRPLLGTKGLPVVRPRPGRYLGRGPRTPGHRIRFWDEALVAERERLRQFCADLEQDRTKTGSDVFTLLCRRRRLGHNSWLHGGVREGQAEAVAWLAAEDMARLGLVDGSTIRLETEAATLELPVASASGIPCRTIVVPHGLPDYNINRLIPSHPTLIEPLSGQHHMTGVPVRVVSAASDSCGN